MIKQTQTQTQTEHKGKIFSAGGFYSDKEIMGSSLDKIAFMWTPRAGCSATCQCIYDIMGLLNDALDYNPFIHEYRQHIFVPNAQYLSLKKLILDKYTIIKTIVNPYQRAVSIWNMRLPGSEDMTFREFTKSLVNGEFQKISVHHEYHARNQYYEGEEKYISKYIKIDKNETFEFVKKNGSKFVIDISKYKSMHHTKRNNFNSFAFYGDIKLINIHTFPLSYRNFYDDEIKNTIYNHYKTDFDHYNYTFDDLT